MTKPIGSSSAPFFNPHAPRGDQMVSLSSENRSLKKVEFWLPVSHKKVTYYVDPKKVSLTDINTMLDTEAQQRKEETQIYEWEKARILKAHEEQMKGGSDYRMERERKEKEWKERKKEFRDSSRVRVPTPVQPPPKKGLIEKVMDFFF